MEKSQHCLNYWNNINMHLSYVFSITELYLDNSTLKASRLAVRKMLSLQLCYRRGTIFPWPHVMFHSYITTEWISFKPTFEKVCGFSNFFKYFVHIDLKTVLKEASSIELFPAHSGYCSIVQLGVWACVCMDVFWCYKTRVHGHWHNLMFYIRNETQE